MRPVLRREVRSDLAPLFTMTGSAVPGIKTSVQGALAATNARQAFSSAHSREPPPADPRGGRRWRWDGRAFGRADSSSSLWLNPLGREFRAGIWSLVRDRDSMVFHPPHDPLRRALGSETVIVFAEALTHDRHPPS